ncbi:hypothetical protein V512_015200 [Mesotoga sp. Brook.08.105.5.1]|nr:hypothetical protein V512_015200 [Mesotoga sp. Brook.08.105.5.1]RAO96543.1 hypothetical protein M388_14185 [Mesotoga sp. Brook.08.YT.4.2.5.4.]
MTFLMINPLLTQAFLIDLISSASKFFVRYEKRSFSFLMDPS